MDVILVSYMKGELQFEVIFGKVPKRVFRTKREELTGGWIKITNEELNDFYPSPGTIRFLSYNKTN
jgi:hypothetical protein